MSDAATPVTSAELYNLLQAQKNWPSGGPPVLFDVRPAEEYAVRHIRGAHRAGVSAEGELQAPAGSWLDKVVCVYDAVAEQLEDHAVFQVWMLHVEKELDVGAGDSPWKPLRAYARARSALRELDPKLGGDGPHTMDK